MFSMDPEMLKQRLFAFGADVRNLVKHRVTNRATAQFTMIGKRKAVSLIPQPLNEMECRIVMTKRNRFRFFGQENMLEPFGKPDNRKMAKV